MNEKFKRLKALLEFSDDQQRVISNELGKYLNEEIPEYLKIKNKELF